MADAVVWHGCYSGGWGKNILVAEAFSHPAKFAPGLICRIIRHGLERGYWRPGEVLGDPFAGIGCGGIVAAYHGLRWVGVELEPKFVKLAKANFKLHRRRWEAVRDPLPVIIQGDSRHFSEIVGGLDSIATSPPFRDARDNTTRPTTRIRWGPAAIHAKTINNFGTSPGQIGNLRGGSLDAVATSPPYSAIAAGAGGLNTKPPKQAGQQSGRSAKSASQNADQRYGHTEGQIAALPEGKLDAISTSPPYENSMDTAPDDPTVKRLSATARAKLSKSDLGGRNYRSTPGQIGSEVAETYWQAVAAVYHQCLLALKPGGVMAVVIKDYVRNKKRVPLCDQTWTLLLRLGFEPIDRVKAMLVEEQEHAGLFGKVVKRKERKSFFRRLDERNKMIAAHWLTVGRNQQARFIQEAHNDLWADYRLRVAEFESRAAEEHAALRQEAEDHDEDYGPPKSPNRRSIEHYAKIVAYGDAGEPFIDLDTRIDQEEVLFVRKP